MKKRISILVFVPIVVFVAFAALLWALLHHTRIQDRDDMFRQVSAQASRLASRLAKKAEVDLVERHDLFLSDAVHLAQADRANHWFHALTSLLSICLSFLHTNGTEKILRKNKKPPQRNLSAAAGQKFSP